MTIVFVVCGGMIGAPLRYLIDRAVAQKVAGVFPWGTFLVNILGCLALGGLTGTGLVLSNQLFALLGVGLCGALTTYSTFSYETFRLLEQRAHFAAVANVLVSVVAGISAAFLGFIGMSALFG